MIFRLMGNQVFKIIANSGTSNTFLSNMSSKIPECFTFSCIGTNLKYSLNG